MAKTTEKLTTGRNCCVPGCISRENSNSDLSDGTKVEMDHFRSPRGVSTLHYDLLNEKKFHL